MDEKVKIARLSIFSNSFLIVLKLVVGIVTNSVSLISEAIHSAIDLIASIIAFFSVKISSKPPDKEHPYGHGKYENVSGVIEGVLIFIAAIWIIVEALNRLLDKSEIEHIHYGVLIMFISMVTNWVVSGRLYKVAKKHDSIALEADALHLKTDVYTSLGVGIGLILIYFTGYIWLDSVVAILVALLILKESYELISKAFSPLVDTQLPNEEIYLIENEINYILKKYDNISINNLRTRKSGHLKIVDFILMVPDNTPVKKAHDICDEIENKLKDSLKNIEINIHIEPNGILK